MTLANLCQMNIALMVSPSRECYSAILISNGPPEGNYQYKRKLIEGIWSFMNFSGPR